MKKLSTPLTIMLFGLIALMFTNCGPGQKSEPEDEPKAPLEAEATEESTPTYGMTSADSIAKGRLTTIVLIVNLQSLKAASEMDSAAYEVACYFAGQKDTVSLKDFTTNVKKNSRIIWAGEPSDPDSDILVDIVEVALIDDGSDYVLEKPRVKGDKNGLALGKVKKKIKEKVQAYSISFRVSGQEYKIDPKLRILE